MLPMQSGDLAALQFRRMADYYRAIKAELPTCLHIRPNELELT